MSNREMHSSDIEGGQTDTSRVLAKWEPDNNPQQARRIGKTLEELGELSAVLARISIQGIDAIDPGSGKTNRQRLLEESADVLAQLYCNHEFFDFHDLIMEDRKNRKIQEMRQWESHFHNGA
jgi:NTP pyrophosphatase (non-canonical NTP hydrolase)